VSKKILSEVDARRLTASVAVDGAVTLRQSLIVARVKLDRSLPRGFAVVVRRQIESWHGVVGRR